MGSHVCSTVPGLFASFLREARVSSKQCQTGAEMAWKGGQCPCQRQSLHEGFLFAPPALGVTPRAYCMPGKLSAAEPHPQLSASEL